MLSLTRPVERSMESETLSYFERSMESETLSYFERSMESETLSYFERSMESHNQPHKYLDLNIKSVGIT
ncbi:hypothetical protein FF021_21055, partial [Leptospira noguchii]